MEDYLIKAGPALLGNTAERYLAMLYTLGHSPPRCDESVQAACNLIIRYLNANNFFLNFNHIRFYLGTATN